MNKSTALANQPKQGSILANYNPEQLRLLQNDIAKGATQDELIYFLTVCKTQNLDPFAKQIHFVKRGDQMSIQTGIDGFRAIAENTGQYAGSDDAIFDPKDEQAAHPEKATVTVYKIVKNTRVPFTASARWIEYCPKQANMAFMWQKMPYNMLAKCAEALALRKAFPKVLGRIYAEEEMHQAGDKATAKVTTIDAEPVYQQITSDKVQKINYLLKEKNKDLKKMLTHFNVEKIEDMTAEQADTAITMLESVPSPKPAVEEAPAKTDTTKDDVETLPSEPKPKSRGAQIAMDAMKKGKSK